MGMFSFNCKKCNKPLKNNKDNVVLFHLKKGKVKQKMEGIYDGYGRVHGDEWKSKWQNVVNNMWDNDESYGVAAFHFKCFHGQVPLTRSEQDENQGF